MAKCPGCGSELTSAGCLSCYRGTHNVQAFPILFCFRCGMGLTALGGLLFSPPDSQGRTVKRHVCPTCHDAIVRGTDAG